jgi:N-methylhydantoinase B
MFSRTLATGNAIYHRTAGAGGWGDPLDRPPEAVARDVLNEKVSVAAAGELYGVIVTDECDVDLPATLAARSRIRAARTD